MVCYLTEMKTMVYKRYKHNRYLIYLLIFICFISLSTITVDADTQVSKQSVVSNKFWDHNIQSSSLQFALYSYKPQLGELNNFLQNVGVTNAPVALMPTFSAVFQHRPELDSRIEIGYWRTELQTVESNSLSLTTTLVPISYQLLYRPVLLNQYLPIYFGVGIGFLRVRFQGNVVNILAEQGIMLANTTLSSTGYVIVGIELFQWQSQADTPAKFGNNTKISIELKRILKTVETTGTIPLNIVLDGTAIGLGVRTQF